MFKMIVAMDKNRGIGKDNKLLCHLPKDLEYFKDKTKNHAIIMGRKTFESLPKILPNRLHVVISNDEEYYEKIAEKYGYENEVMTFTSIEDAIIFLKYNEDYYGMDSFVIGGQTIYKQFMPFVDELYVTHIDESFEADTFFPVINHREWEISSICKGINTNELEPKFLHTVYKKRY